MEIHHLGRDVTWVGRGIKGVNIVNPGSAGDQALPKRVFADSDRGDHPQPSDGNPARMFRFQRDSFNACLASTLGLSRGELSKVVRSPDVRPRVRKLAYRSPS